MRKKQTTSNSPSVWLKMLHAGYILSKYGTKYSLGSLVKTTGLVLVTPVSKGIDNLVGLNDRQINVEKVVTGLVNVGLAIADPVPFVIASVGTKLAQIAANSVISHFDITNPNVRYAIETASEAVVLRGTQKIIQSNAADKLNHHANHIIDRVPGLSTLKKAAGKVDAVSKKASSALGAIVPRSIFKKKLAHSPTKIEAFGTEGLLRMAVLDKTIISDNNQTTEYLSSLTKDISSGWMQAERLPSPCSAVEEIDPSLVFLETKWPHVAEPQNPAIAVYYFSEPLRNPIINKLSFIDHRARHTGLIFDVPGRGLIRLEVDPDVIGTKRAMAIKETVIDEYHRQTHATTEKWHTGHPVGTTYLSLDRIRLLAYRWQERNRIYNMFSVNCRTFTDYMLDRLHCSERVGSQVEKIERSIRKNGFKGNHYLRSRFVNTANK